MNLIIFFLQYLWYKDFEQILTNVVISQDNQGQTLRLQHDFFSGEKGGDAMK